MVLEGIEARAHEREWLKLQVMSNWVGEWTGGEMRRIGRTGLVQFGSMRSLLHAIMAAEFRFMRLNDATCWID